MPLEYSFEEFLKFLDIRFGVEPSSQKEMYEKQKAIFEVVTALIKNSIRDNNNLGDFEKNYLMRYFDNLAHHFYVKELREPIGD